MYGLEYALFFGVPDNKGELINGYSPWTFPFDSRESAETDSRMAAAGCHASRRGKHANRRRPSEPTSEA
jgi:hypothetical protein